MSHDILNIQMTSFSPNTDDLPNNINKTYKVKWTESEDARLLEIVGRFGSNRWDFIATFIPGRTGRQCRERWMIRYAPDIKKDAWTHEEDLMLIHLQKIVGNHWSAISKSLQGRTPIMIKNRFKLLCRHQRLKDGFTQNCVIDNICQQISLPVPKTPVQLEEYPMNLDQNNNIVGRVSETDVNVNCSKNDDYEDIDYSNEFLSEEAIVF